MNFKIYKYKDLKILQNLVAILVQLRVGKTAAMNGAYNSLDNDLFYSQMMKWDDFSLECDEE